MRPDVKSLLDRLDRQQFRYQDFSEVADEIELWPLFQALLRDPRIVGFAAPPALAAPARDVTLLATKPELPVSARVGGAAPPVGAGGALFDRYRTAARSSKVDSSTPDLRQFLARAGGERA